MTILLPLPRLFLHLGQPGRSLLNIGREIGHLLHLTDLDEGLLAGEQVAASGSFKLRDTTLVRRAGVLLADRIRTSGRPGRRGNRTRAPDCAGRASGGDRVTACRRQTLPGPSTEATASRWYRSRPDGRRALEHFRCPYSRYIRDKIRPCYFAAPDWRPSFTRTCAEIPCGLRPVSAACRRRSDPNLRRRRDRAGLLERPGSHECPLLRW